MTQQEVLEFLEKHKGEWFTLKEIRDKIEPEKKTGSFHANLCRMYKSEVCRRLYGLERKDIGGRLLGYKWRVRDEEG